MPDRSLIAYDYFKDLTQRAEYLTMGVLAASIGFFWQTHEPQVLGFNPSTLHLLGMLVLFAAFGVSFRRIHLMPQIYGVMAHDLDQAGKRSELVKSASQGKPIVSDKQGILSPSEQFDHIQDIDRKRAAYKKQSDKLHDRVESCFRWRNILMILGYTLMLIQRVWVPYYNLPQP